MNRPDPRILESLYILAGLFWPDLFKEEIPNNSVVPWGLWFSFLPWGFYADKEIFR
ncbi:MAG: hypothetical protein HY609_06410 [Deltaproteobacteria bacterium]|nr:hypothetical protein [Deltaproteobacteria bacterium]MBI4224551.1 hypothetical protein [Deltaproteobacteria bacterium]